MLIPLMAAMLWLGIGASSFIDPYRGDVQHEVARIESARRGE